MNNESSGVPTNLILTDGDVPFGYIHPSPEDGGG
jgi:hypothetical protein